jgi:formiminotetrahydrofolate cyclodeaminase
VNPLDHTSFAELLDQVSSRTPAPGGGAVTSAVASLSAALGAMVVAYSDRSPEGEAARDTLVGAADELRRAQRVLLDLAAEDAEAYALVSELKKLPKDDARREQLAAAQAASLAVPIAVIATAVDLLRLFEAIAPLSNKWLRSDLAISAVLADATVRASAWTVAVNLPSHPDRTEAERIGASSRATVAESAERAARIENACRI